MHKSARDRSIFQTFRTTYNIESTDPRCRRLQSACRLRDSVRRSDGSVDSSFVNHSRYTKSDHMRVMLQAAGCPIDSQCHPSLKPSRGAQRRESNEFVVEKLNIARPAVSGWFELKPKLLKRGRSLKALSAGEW